MQIFIHFINKIFKTTDKSKGADTGFENKVILSTSLQKIQEIFSCLVKMFKEIFNRNISELSKLVFYQLPEK